MTITIPLRFSSIVDFGVPADHSVKLKEIAKRDKYQDLRREQKKLWNIIGAIQTTVLLRSSRILRRVLESWRDLLSLKLQWKPSANAGVEKNL